MNPYPFGVSPDGPIWGVFTYSFIHTDTLHLVLNCAVLGVLLIIKRGFVLLKIAALIIGPVTVGLIFREVMSGQTVMVGASIAVYSLLGLYTAPPGIRWRVLAIVVLAMQPFTHPVASGWHLMGFATGCTIYFMALSLRGLTEDRG